MLIFKEELICAVIALCGCCILIFNGSKLLICSKNSNHGLNFAKCFSLFLFPWEFFFYHLFLVQTLLWRVMFSVVKSFLCHKPCVLLTVCISGQLWNVPSSFSFCFLFKDFGVFVPPPPLAAPSPPPKPCGIHRLCIWGLPSYQPTVQAMRPT